ncbi:hypothetical protein PFJ87_06g01900 [Encephalitozoon hellem]|uniref:Uncharacterized protein n=1 Tax=Encephalitozoon hellem TaxID=27973 RepID=A0ABY8CNU9_ENCHE|nr:hypothetical protein PFJ87_06g01900 [Encephalitozoon hellem]
MNFFLECKNFMLERWRYLEDIFFMGCVALQYNCDTGDFSMPISIAFTAAIYLFIKTTYGLFDGFEEDDDRSFTVFDFLKTLLIVIHILVYFLSFIAICEIFRCKREKNWTYGIDDRSLIVTHTLYMFLASQTIMANISTNSVVEIIRSILGFYEVATLSGVKNDKDYGGLLHLTYPMIFSFLPFFLGEATSIVRKWLFRNKLSEFAPRIAKMVTIIAAIMCTAVGMYGTFVMFNIIGNIASAEAKIESGQSTSGIQKVIRRTVSSLIPGILKNALVGI